MTDERDVKKIIEGRSKTHGGYLRNAEITWSIMDTLMTGSRWHDLHPAQKETLHMIAHKMHRIVNGDPMFLDHWVDIEGYTHLIVENIDKIRGTVLLPLGDKFSREQIMDTLMNTTREIRVGEAVDTPAQTAMTLAPEPSELSPRPASAPAGTGIAAAPAEASDERPTGCETCGGTGEIEQGLGGVGSMQLRVPCPDCAGEQQSPSDHVNDRRVPRYQPQPQKQPISATHAEFESVKALTIPTGSMREYTWSALYLAEPRDDGRWHMIGMYHTEYGL